jgi:hypothetical protein
MAEAEGDGGGSEVTFIFWPFFNNILRNELNYFLKKWLFFNHISLFDVSYITVTLCVLMWVLNLAVCSDRAMAIWHREAPDSLNHVNGSNLKKWSDSFLKYWLKKNKIEKISYSNFRYAAAPESLVHSVSNNFRNKPFSNVHCLVKVSILHRKVLIFFVMIEWNV